MPSFCSDVEDDYDDFALRRAGVPVKQRKAPEWSVVCQECGHENPVVRTSVRAVSSRCRGDEDGPHRVGRLPPHMGVRPLPYCERNNTVTCNMLLL